MITTTMLFRPLPPGFLTTTTSCKDHYHLMLLPATLTISSWSPSSPPGHLSTTTVVLRPLTTTWPQGHQRLVSWPPSFVVFRDHQHLARLSGSTRLSQLKVYWSGKCGYRIIITFAAVPPSPFTNRQSSSLYFSYLFLFQVRWDGGEEWCGLLPYR